jgi:hypothetical protein
VSTPHEAVAEALVVSRHALVVSRHGGLYNPEIRAEGYDRRMATVAIEALRERVRPLDRDHSPPSHSPSEWEMFCDGFATAVTDILSASTNTSDTSPESTENGGES